jgi:hypothetical protein
MQEDPALLWKKLLDTYALAPAYGYADASQDQLKALKQNRGPSSFLTFVQSFDAQVEIVQEALIAAGRTPLDDPTLIAYARKGFDPAHHTISLSLLAERNYHRFIQEMSQRSFMSGLSSFQHDRPRDRSSGQRHGDNGDQARAALSASGATVTCYGCGNDGHIRRECSVPDIRSHVCANCGTTGHMKKACRRAPAKGSQAGQQGNRGGDQDKGGNGKNGKSSGSGASKSSSPRLSKAEQALKLLKVAKQETEKIQARAEKRANAYAAAARAARDLEEDMTKTKIQSNNAQGEEFINEPDDGEQQFQAPARNGGGKGKQRGNLAYGGSLRSVLLLSLCLTLLAPAQSSSSFSVARFRWFGWVPVLRRRRHGRSFS